MYLLHVQEPDNGNTSLIIRLQYHAGRIPRYAILSHRWGLPSDEVTFQDMMGDTEAAKLKKGYEKVENCCLQALKYCLNYVWIDTCCINKSSSAELSEAINSMWRWYRDAGICFAYLEDVSYDTFERFAYPDSSFCMSSWFQRGWTLQELIAPLNVIFFPKQWGPRKLGNRISLSDIITAITGIRKDVLLDRFQVDFISIAERMSWASRRRTTRAEDEAYSLMGLFGVNMATIYGEGRKAFIRLQEDILRKSTDQTIFAWSGIGGFSGMLAASPGDFKDSANYVPLEFNDFSKRFRLYDTTSPDPQDDDTGLAAGVQLVYSMTNIGLQISLAIAKMPGQFPDYYFAFIACANAKNGDSTIIFLKHRQGRPRNHFYRVSFGGIEVIHKPPPKQGYPSNLTARPLWISNGDESSKLNLDLCIKVTPQRRFIRLRIKSSAVFGHVTLSDFPYLRAKELQAATDVYPKALWNDNADGFRCARIGSNQFVVLTCEDPFGRDWGGHSLVFVFGLHNDRVWLSFEGDVPLRPADDIYEEFDLFSFGKRWKNFSNKISFLNDDSRRTWRISKEMELGSAQNFQIPGSQFTSEGDVIEDFELWFFMSHGQELF